jgi:hypothetical protein
MHSFAVQQVKTGFEHAREVFWMNKKDSAGVTEANIPIRNEPLPLEFPGLHYMDDQEIEAAVRVLKRRSPFR